MLWSVFFFFNDTATTEIYTLSLHDALPIFAIRLVAQPGLGVGAGNADVDVELWGYLGLLASLVMTYGDRKSTRLNSSHANISYAVFCLKKKKNTNCIIKFIYCSEIHQASRW